MLALGDDGAAYIWGYRGYGISGTGVTTVSSTAAVSVVRLPGERKIVKLIGGTEDNYDEYTRSYVAALADDGTVWTWGGHGTNSDVYLGRPTTSSAQLATPGQVTSIPGKVVDLLGHDTTAMALTENGEVYTWGDSNGHGEDGQGQGAYGSASARIILTGVHSIATSLWASWAVVGPNWTSTGYASGADKAATLTQGDGKAGMLFWGRNDHVQGGSPAGDPKGVSDSTFYKPVKLSDTAVLNQLLAAGTAAGDDNLTLGVAMGSAADRGTFRSLTGSYYGNVALLRNGDVYTWGNSTYYASGQSGTTTTNATQIPVKLVATYAGQQVKFRAVAHTNDIYFLVDESNTAWMYGRRNYSGQFPDANGAPVARGSSNSVALLYRIDGGTAYPGWAAGGISEMGGTGYTMALRRTDGSYWAVNGTTKTGTTNGDALIRNWVDSRNTIPTGSSSSQPLTLLNLDPGYITVS
jgi:hypothetical protein